MQIQAGISQENYKSAVLYLNNSFKRWSDLSLKVRIKKVRRFRKLISKNARRIAETISKECGRPLIEALSQEVLPVLEMAKHCEKKYPQWLARRKLPYRRPGFWRKRNYLYYEPIGAVAVFSPQNFPFSLGMMTLVYTILAGNTVVLKPSEKSKFVPLLIDELLKEAGLIASGAAVVLPGDARLGQWLIRHPSIKKLFFFGNSSTGKKVADLCRIHSKPFVLETGGGSTAYVCADSDIEQAAAGLVWSSFYTHGRSCVSTEKIYVDEKIAAHFISCFKEKVTNFQKEMMGCMDLEMNNNSNFSRWDDLIEDAKTKGADIFQAGIPRSYENKGFFKFTVISNATHSMQVYKEEIFGPLVAIQAVPNLSDTIDKLGKNFQTMGISIWSRNIKKIHALAKKMAVGMIWVNDSSFGLPHLPWGRIDNAGFGSLFSEFSIQEVTRQKWISIHPARISRKRYWWNPYTSSKEKIISKVAENFF
jgi:acyl-CoA reductase-like NAD-dependent aldehyde dehydrogenase